MSLSNSCTQQQALVQRKSLLEQTCRSTRLQDQHQYHVLDGLHAETDGQMKPMRLHCSHTSQGAADPSTRVIATFRRPDQSCVQTAVEANAAPLCLWPSPPQNPMGQAAAGQWPPSAWKPFKVMLRTAMYILTSQRPCAVRMLCSSSKRRL